MSNDEIRNALKATTRCEKKHFVRRSRNTRSRSSRPCTRSIRCTAKCSGVHKINPVSIAVRLHNLWRASKATEWGKSLLRDIHGAHSETYCIQTNSTPLRTSGWLPSFGLRSSPAWISGTHFRRKMRRHLILFCLSREALPAAIATATPDMKHYGVRWYRNFLRMEPRVKLSASPPTLFVETIQQPRTTHNQQTIVFGMQPLLPLCHTFPRSAQSTTYNFSHPAFPPYAPNVPTPRLPLFVRFSPATPGCPPGARS